MYSFLLSILEAYRTGRGSITVRGKTDIELLDSKTKRTAIIIKEVSFLFPLNKIVIRMLCFYSQMGLDWITSMFFSFLKFLKQIPYQTNKASLVEKIAELVENKVVFWCLISYSCCLAASPYTEINPTKFYISKTYDLKSLD